MKEKYTSLVRAENAVDIDVKVSERLAKHPPFLRLGSKGRRHVREIFNQKYIDELEKTYNVDNLYFEFGLLSCISKDELNGA